MLTTAYVANNITDTTAFTNVLGVQTQAQQNASQAGTNAVQEFEQHAQTVVSGSANVVGTDSNGNLTIDTTVAPISQQVVTLNLLQNIGAVNPIADGTTLTQNQMTSIINTGLNNVYQSAYQQALTSYSGANGSMPVVGFWTAVGQAIVADLPNIVGQVASMSVRLAALKWAGVGAQDNISNALGMDAQMIASTATQNTLTPSQQTPLL